MGNYKSKTGRTTRLVDNAVQYFFNLKKGKSMLLTDHGHGLNDTLKLINIFDVRMQTEHPNEKYLINYSSKTIKRL